MNNRDLQLTIRQRFDQKQNIQSYKRVVITDAQGNQSGSGTIWANRKLRRVWYMAHGASQPAQAYCSGAKIPNPQIGMRAFLGFAENSNEPELFEDPTLRKTNTTGQPVTITPEDLQPGGRYFLWIQSKAIQPLATFPTSNTGLKVTVVAGYYPYSGTRKYYGGVVGLSLAASVPTIGLKRKVGLYLNSSNVLQTVNGSTVATTTIAPDPTWPTGAFRLSMVTLEYGQSAIDFSTDIEDARMLFSDENGGGGGGGWPFANVLTVSTTDTDADYSTIAAAITAAASSGDTIELDSETYSLSAQQAIDKSLTIVGHGPEATIIDFNLANTACLDFTADSITVVFRNLTIDHSAGGSTLAGVLFTNNSGVKVILDNCIVKKSGGAPSTGYGAWWLAGTLELRNGSKLLCTSGTAQYGVLNDSSGDVTITIGPGCEVGGATADVYSNRAGSVLNVTDCTFTNGYTDWAGDVNGQYHGAKLVTNASGATAPSRDVGYINASGDYVTTTTANYFGGNCVVVVGGGNGLKCFVATSGRWSMRYAGSAPSDGDFLVTSTTAGAAGLQTTMRPEIFARCQAAGSSNVVTALLLTERQYVSKKISSYLWYSYLSGNSGTRFVSTINTGSGSLTSTNVPYGTVTAGNENCLKPDPTQTSIGKARLHNTTRGTYRLITDVNLGTNNITTVASTDAWANGDTITIESQTVTSPSATEKYIDLDLSQQTDIPELAAVLFIGMTKNDTGAGNTNLVLHPFESFSSSKNDLIINPVANQYFRGKGEVGIISRVITYRSGASGTNTAIEALALVGYWLATP